MFKGLKIGDRVAVAQRRGHAEWAVGKVGRKYFTAGRVEFCLEDGSLRSGYSTPRASTLEGHALDMRAAAAEKAMHAVNVVIDYGAKDRRARVLSVYEVLKPMIDAEAAQVSSPAPKGKP